MPDNFDSVAFMDTLIEGGFPEKQAKAPASALFQLIDSQLVTKSYLDLRLAQDLARLKSELLQWVFGLLIVQTGMTAVFFKLLH